jgi:ABC-2 type transport system permease protein
MIAVLRHELASYFTNVTGYVFGAFLLLFGGIYTMVININAAVSSFEYVLSNMSFVFLVIVPILTMRVIAEERRQKTDQLLYALPIRMTQVALGKYLALLIVFLVPVAILGLFPLLLSAYGDVYLPAAYGTLVGFFFLGAALIAIGMFISSVTESQAVAAGLCFVVMLVNYFMSSLTDYIPSTTQASLVAFTIAALLLGLVIDRLTRSFVAGAAVTIVIIVGLLAVFFVDSSLLAGRFSAVVSQLSLFERFYVFVNGVFDVTGIVYFLSVIGVFLFLTVQSLEKRRWSE